MFTTRPWSLQAIPSNAPPHGAAEAPVPAAVEVGDQEERYWPFGSREDLMDMRMASWEVGWEREGGSRLRNCSFVESRVSED